MQNNCGFVSSVEKYGIVRFTHDIVGTPQGSIIRQQIYHQYFYHYHYYHYHYYPWLKFAHLFDLAPKDNILFALQLIKEFLGGNQASL